MQRRPGFPAKLPVPGNAAAGKPATEPPSVALRKPAVAPAPAGVGLDSSAVRARMVQKLAAGGITTRDDLADLAVHELMELTGQSEDEAKALILKAREHWFAAGDE